jgi:hypothetical protein
MKFNPIPTDVTKLESGNHIWIKKIKCNDKPRNVGVGFEAKGYLIETDISKSALDMIYYWIKKDTNDPGKEGANFFHTSMIMERKGHILTTFNSVYEIYDLAEQIDAPDFHTVLRQILIDNRDQPFC